MYIDTHLDTRWQSRRVNRDFSTQSDEGHVDLPRAREAGLLLGFFTGFPTESGYATERMMRDWLEFTAEPLNRFDRISSLRALDQHLEHFKSSGPQERNIGAVLHFEGAAGIDTELNRLYIYHELGLRSMGLTWNEQNQFATGVTGEKDRGLTTEGRDLVDKMADLGIIVDVSHLNDKSFWDMVEHYEGPLIASHSNLRKWADHPRNLTDDMAKAIIDTGGSIGINFCSGFLSTKEDHPANRGCAKEMIKGVIDLGSLDNVHIGSDFDGCTVPEDIGDIRGVPQLLDDLTQELDLTQKEQDRIAHGNMLRIIRQVWRS